MRTARLLFLAALMSGTFVLAAEKTGDTSAPASLETARRTRLQWQNFPGFQADIVALADGQKQTGQITVGRDGDIKVTGFEPSAELTRTLDSWIGHRFPSDSASDESSYAEEAASHPFGRLIKVDSEASMASTCRVQQGVLREVNRITPSGKFTISVLEVMTNAKGAYVPTVYTVSYWNKDGSLKTARTVRDQWTQVGDYDLPGSRLWVTTGADLHSVQQVELKNFRLGNAAE